MPVIRVPAHDSTRWEDWVKRQKEVADELNVEWNQGHAHFYRWKTAGEDEREWHEELIRRSIIGAGIMGVKWLVIHPGTVSDDIWYSPEKSLEANLKAYRRYGELASKHNVGIAIENMIESRPGRRYASSTEELLELYEEWMTRSSESAGIRGMLIWLGLTNRLLSKYR